MFLFHYTRTKNLLSILEEGLIPDKGISMYYPETHTFEKGKLHENKVWLDTNLYRLKTPDTAVVTVNTDYLLPSKLEKYKSFGRTTHWYVYYGEIPPVAIKLYQKVE